MLPDATTETRSGPMQGLTSRLQAVPYKWHVAVVFVIGLFMDLMDTTIVNVALPTLGRTFGVTSDTTLEWIITGYLLSLAVWIPASGWLGDRFGTKRIFVFALVMFTLGSALCGEATSISQLIFFRVIQGIGGGMLTPVGTAMLFRAFPPNERARASAVLLVPAAIAPATGPILGGVLVDYASWNWIFRVNIPIGIVGIILAVVLLKEHTEPNVGRFDLPGFLLAGIGLPLVLYALSQAPNAGWDSAEVLLTGLGGLALLALFVAVELRTREPMLKLRLFRDRMFRSANIVFFTAAAALLGVLFPLESGLTTFPQALGLIVATRLAGRLYPKVGPRRMMMAGMLGIAVSSALFLMVGLATDLWWIRGIMLLRGIAFGTALLPLQAATFSTIPQADSGQASSLFNTNRQVGSSVGIAILATVLTGRGQSHVATAQPTLASFHEAYLAAALVALLGMGFAFLIHDKDAAATMVPKGNQLAARPATAD
jgi:EmrB/QacA subfamily drug resistance transporter